MQVSFFLIIAVSVGDSNGSGSEWDEGKNATVRRFCPRSHENKELKEAAMPRHATTIFSEVSPVGCQSRD